MSDERAQAAEDAIEKKEAAAEATPGLDDPSRAAGTGGDVGSHRAADELSQQSVEEAAAANAKPLNAATGVDDVRATDETDDEE